MALISDKDREAVRKAFDSQLDENVTMVLFTFGEDSPDHDDCQFCSELEELVEELAGLSDKLQVVNYDFEANSEEREQYGVQRAPALVLVGDEDRGVRYYGIPSGYEAQSLIEDIIDVSARTTSLSAETKQWLAQLDKPVHLQVFVTPTCPYCPGAVRVAHQLALESDMVTGDMVEAMEFPDLSRQYNVYGVPRVVINEDHYFEGALPEKQYVDEIRKALIGLAPAR